MIVAAMLLTYLIVNATNQTAFGETGGTTALVEIDPFRLVDTRIDLGDQRVDANTIRVTTAGISGIPAGAEALAISITVTEATAPGFLVAYPAGESRQLASNLTYEAGQTISTGAVVTLNSSGAFDIFLLAPAHIVVDVTGAFVSRSASRSGRFVGVTPDRLLDTRVGTPVAAGQTPSIRFPSSVPADATAAIVTLTSTAPNAPGYFTAYASGPRPFTSTLNVSAANSTRATTAIVPISDQTLNIYSSGGGHLIVDLIGYFTGPSAAQTTTGLFVPTTPKRYLDTRESLPLQSGETRSFTGTSGGVALGAFTMIGDGTPGYAVLFANGTAKPETSSINLSDTQVISNLAVTRVSSAGINVYSSSDAHYVFDQFGYFIGDPVAIVEPTAPTTPAPRKPKTTGCSVSELLVPSCGVWFGASTPSRDGSFDYTRGLAEYEAVAQNTPDILHFYKTGGVKFPTSEEIAMSDRPGKQRSLLLYNWKPSQRLTWRQIAQGGADSEIATVAASLKKYPHQLFLNIFHEPEDNVKSSSTSGMTTKDYADMYRHVVTLMRSKGVNNAVFVWNVMGYEGWESYLDGLYPGDSYVDWICYDPYAKMNLHDDLAEIINRPRPDLGWPGFYAWASAKAPSKPMMLCEYGVDLGSNSTPASVLRGDAASMLAKYPRVKALVYWNDIDSKVNVRLDDPSSKGVALGKAYRELAAQPIFNTITPDIAP